MSELGAGDTQAVVPVVHFNESRQGYTLIDAVDGRLQLCIRATLHVPDTGAARLDISPWPRPTPSAEFEGSFNNVDGRPNLDGYVVQYFSPTLRRGHMAIGVNGAKPDGWPRSPEPALRTVAGLCTLLGVATELSPATQKRGPVLVVQSLPLRIRAGEKSVWKSVPSGAVALAGIQAALTALRTYPEDRKLTFSHFES